MQKAGPCLALYAFMGLLPLVCPDWPRNSEDTRILFVSSNSGVKSEEAVLFPPLE